MNLQQHKLAWEDFEEWYDTDFYFKQKTHIRGRAILYSLPFEMQLGVYLKYLDEYNIHLDVSWTCTYHNDEKEGFQINKWDYSLYEYGYCVADEIGEFKTMNEAWEEAIEQAFKIRNEQLTK